MSRKLRQLVKTAEKRAATFKGLLALLLSAKKRKLSDVTFNSQSGQFSVGGTLIGIGAIRLQLEQLENSLAKVMAEYARKLHNQQWTVEQWKAAMLELLEESHLLFGALAIGSVALAADNNIVEARVLRDERYLGSFAVAFKRGKLTSLPVIARRAQSYLRSAYITYSQVEMQLKILNGYTEARRVLRAKESCPGCLSYHGRWVPIREMPALGTLECGQYCKCYIVYR